MTREEKIEKAAQDYCGHDTEAIYAHIENAFIAGTEWADAHPQWISVEDELPPCNVFVLTCDGQGNTNLLMLAGNGRWYDKAVGLHLNITHWMPKPAPPTGDKSSPVEKGGEK